MWSKCSYRKFGQSCPFYYQKITLVPQIFRLLFVDFTKSISSNNLHLVKKFCSCISRPCSSISNVSMNNFNISKVIWLIMRQGTRLDSNTKIFMSSCPMHRTFGKLGRHFMYIILHCLSRKLFPEPYMLSCAINKRRHSTQFLPVSLNFNVTINMRVP